MRKSFLTGCLVALMMSMMVPVYALEETEVIVEETLDENTRAVPSESQYDYYISSGKVTIRGLVDPNYSMDIHLEIPATIENYPVVAIDDRAFKNNMNIKSVSFELAENLTTIGREAFYNCVNLEGTLTLPASLTTMGASYTDSGVFAYTQISKLIVEDGSLPLEISHSAFYECSALEEVELSARVTSIGNSAFYRAVSLVDFEWASGTYEQNIGSYAFAETALTHFKAPDSLVSIDSYAFFDQSYLKSIELNEGLKSIGLNAFANCVSLTGKIVIPSTVTSFGSSSIDAGPFYNTAITELVIKEGTEPLEIQARSFAGCYQLHTVDLPARVTCIGNSAFEGAISLENFYWASGDWEQKIESFAFEGTRLSSFEAPNRLTSIGSYAFCDMTTLETVVLNDKLQSIGSGAFYGCINLSGKITLPSTLNSLYVSVFDEGAFESTGITEVEIIGNNNTKLEIGESTFENCMKLEKVTLPGRVVAIGNSAFAGDASLKKVIWEDGNYDQKIGSNAFAKTALVEFTFPKRLKTMDYRAFFACKNLKSIQTNTMITSIGESAFEGCIKLTGALELPSTVTYINNNAFKNTGFSKISIADGYDTLTIGYEAFGKCLNLLEVTLPGRTKTLSESVFKASANLEALHIENIQEGRTFKNLPSGYMEGYTFEGWLTSGGDAVTTTSEMVSKGVSTVYPQWIAETYDVYFYTNGGSISQTSMKVTYGQPYGKLPTPTYDHYVFDGWYTSFYGGEKVTQDTLVSSAYNHSLFAHWIHEDDYVSDLPFKDVPMNKWFYNSVKWAYETGLLTGTSETTFSPNDPMTRGMLVTVLYRMEGRPGVTAANRFPDVSNRKYYATAITWASSLDLVAGYTNGNFGPEDSITREQIAKILYRYAEYKGYDVSKSAALSEFVDASKVSGYAEKYMKWAVAEGLIQGSNGKLNPKGNATRAEISAILKRFVEKYEVL